MGRHIYSILYQNSQFFNIFKCAKHVYRVGIDMWVKGKNGVTHNYVHKAIKVNHNVRKC